MPFFHLWVFCSFFFLSLIFWFSFFHPNLKKWFFFWPLKSKIFSHDSILNNVGYFCLNFSTKEEILSLYSRLWNKHSFMFNNLCILFPGAASLFKGYVYLVLEFKSISKKRGKLTKISWYLGLNFMGEHLFKKLFLFFSTNFPGATFLFQGVCLFQSLE